MEYSLSFDDVLIVPKFSNIASRKEVNVTSKLCSQSFFPVISANMDSITSSEMTHAMESFGARGCLHRFWTIQENVEAFKKSSKNTFVSFGLGEVELSRAQALKDVGANVFILDVAHGANIAVVNQVKAFREALGYFPSLIVGNFATAHSIIEFENALGGRGFVDGFKVGIGGGSACTTRIVTGCGVSTFDSLLDCSKANVNLIADGGMKTSGDIAKALAVPGVKAVMLGGMLSGADETPGPIIWNQEGGYQLSSGYKKYRGSASQESYAVQGKDAAWRTAEGESFLVPYKGPVDKVLQQIDAGLRSAFSYVGAKNLQEYQEKAKFIRVTENGFRESGPHGKS